MATRDSKGRWIPGSGSPNPGGRPEEFKKINAIAKEWTEEAMQTIIEIMLDVDERGSVRLKAANEVLNRGWGKVAEIKEDDDEQEGITVKIELVDPNAQIN